MYSFTIKGSGLLDQIVTFCAISKAVDNDNFNNPPEPFTVNALWDTGSSTCCISRRVIELLNLKSYGE